MSRLPSLQALSVAALVVALAWAGAPAWADEIHVIDAETCATRVMSVEEVTSETWSEVKYRTRARGPEQSVPARDVVKVVRKEPAREARLLDSAYGDLARGNFRDAMTAFQNIAGGGQKIDAGTGAPTYTPFTEGDPPGRKSRPTWTSEYAHIGYVMALFELARAGKDAKLYDQVLMALEDRELPPVGEGKDKVKRSTGGFLARFEGGNSRWYPQALRIHAHALLGTGDTEKAKAAFKALEDAAGQVPLDPKWLYEGMIGEGLIAESQGQDATSSYDRVAATMLIRLEKETSPCTMRTYGQLYSLARLRVASAKLLQAEKVGGAAFGSLRSYIEAGEPSTLQDKYASKLSEPALRALLAGARMAEIQAVGLNGKGLAYLEEKRFEEAILAFKEVAVKHFADRDQTARALYYLAKAADKAAEAADKRNQASERDRFKAQRDEAVRVLKSRYRSTAWAQK
ncbi:MAG: hypothetical protein AB7T63_06535 [Planctomycetota bacterium]